MSLMFFTASVAAVRRVVTLARELGTGTSGSLKRSHDSSIGHNLLNSAFHEGFPRPESRFSDDSVSSFDQLYHNANISLVPVTLITPY